MISNRDNFEHYLITHEDWILADDDNNTWAKSDDHSTIQLAETMNFITVGTWTEWEFSAVSFEIIDDGSEQICDYHSAEFLAYLKARKILKAIEGELNA
jgi:hypothetical protein